MIFAGIDRLITDTELSGSDLRLFLHLCNVQRPGGWIEDTQAKIAGAMGIAQPTVARSMARLRKQGYVRKDRRECGRLCLRIDLAISGRGGYAILQAKRALERQTK